MSRSKVLLVGSVVLVLPFIGMLAANIFWEKVIFDNPDFWYGYMAYFGTVSLAIVSWLQSIKTEEISKNFMKQQLRQKIGYFGLKENVKNVKDLCYIYQPLQVGQYCNADGTDDHSKDKILGVWIKNIGEDIILNARPIFGKINGKNVSVSSTISVIYKGEEILFELDNTQCFQENCLKIEFLIEMENVTGIHYNQSIDISAENNNATKHGTYIIQEFDTHINFMKN